MIFRLRLSFQRINNHAPLYNIKQKTPMVLNYFLFNQYAFLFLFLKKEAKLSIYVNVQRRLRSSRDHFHSLQYRIAAIIMLIIVIINGRSIFYDFFSFDKLVCGGGAEF